MFSSTQVKNCFKRAGVIDNYLFYLRTISVNGQKRGCNGFIANPENGKICYIDTEPHLMGGLFGNPSKTLMYRQAVDIKDYTGGNNRWGRCENIAEYVTELLA